MIQEKETETKEIKKETKTLYITGDLQYEEIDVVLDFLYMEIDHVFYGNNSYTDLDEKEIQKRRKNKSPVYYSGRGVHEKQFCQACSENVCDKVVKGEYPDLAINLAIIQPVP